MAPRVPAADWLLPGFVAACLVLGGASAAGALANFALQIGGAAILALLLVRRAPLAPAPGGGALLLLAAALVAVPLLQLVPLPAALWTHLPGRADIAARDALFGASFARPVSLQPARTLAVLAGLLPPVAVLLLALQASARARRRALLAVVAVAILSALLGAAQILGGGDSPAYFYAITNRGTSVGFFANSNHLSTLLLAALVLSADLPFHPTGGRAAERWTVARAGLALFLVAALLVNRSLAGIVLLGPALLFWAARQPGVARRLSLQSRALLGGGLALGTAAAALAAVQVPAIGQLLAGFTDPAERIGFLRHTLALAAENFPIGTGFGTFRAAYAAQEDAAAVTTVFVNHAHNDLAELLLEAGIAGPLLLAALAAWVALRLRALAREAAAPAGAWAGAMALGLIALHSLVDYPLRTAAIGAVAVLCLALLVYPPQTAASTAR